MKRLALLIALLLLAAPALAESLSIEDRYSSCTIPESVVLLQVQTEEGTVYLVRARDGSRHLECWNAAGGAPVLSPSLPEGTLLRADPFGEPAVVFPHPAGGQLTVTLRRDGDCWHIDALTVDSGFSWMYAGGFLIAEDGSLVAGQPGFDTDVARVDWLSLPGSYEDALTMLTPAGGEPPQNGCLHVTDGAVSEWTPGKK